MGVLEKIINQKKMEVEERKKNLSIQKLMKFSKFNLPTYSLVEYLQKENKNGIIAEFKRKSPSKGIINPHADLKDITNGYFNNHASGISVLTDAVFFGGSLEDLEYVSNLQIPVLRKDFIIDPYQIYEAKAFGASVILLIASCLTKKETLYFTKIAYELKLEILLEIHNKSEIEYINEFIHIVGINNRNLDNLEINLNNSFQLFPMLKKFNKPIITESGIDNIETIVAFKKFGFSGFLMGEFFMKQTNPALAFASFTQLLNQQLCN